MVFTGCSVFEKQIEYVAEHSTDLQNQKRELAASDQFPCLRKEELLVQFLENSND